VTGASGQHEFRRLKALQETGLLADSRSPELDEICRQAEEHFHGVTALVTLIDKDLQIIKARVGSTLECMPRSHAFCDYTIRTDDVLVVTDATKDHRFASNPFVVGEPFIRFYAGAPLIYMRQVRLGALCLIASKPREFTLGDRAELTLMAEEVVSIIVAQATARMAAKLGL
jgi:GAF domain-containing protein